MSSEIIRGDPAKSSVRRFSRAMELFRRMIRMQRATVAGNSCPVNRVDISKLSDDELWLRTKFLAGAERNAVIDLVEHLAEIDRRGLHEKREYVSLFEYCVHCLRLSEEAAYRRIRVARAIRKFAPISVLLREGRLTLENAALLHPYLDAPDAAILITKCLDLRKWQVQALLAGRQTEPLKRDVVRFCGTPPPKPALTVEAEPQLIFAPKTPVSAPASVDQNKNSQASPQPKASTESPKRTIRVSFSADEDFYKLMQRARSLLRHKYPDGRLEGVLKDALTALLAKKDRGFGWRKNTRGREPARGA